MKKFTFLLLATITFISCTKVTFEDPQPYGVNALNEIPKSLQGTFSFVVLNEETLMEIGSNYISGDEGKAYLSDSVVVKKLGDRYVINRLVARGGEEKDQWDVYVLQNKGCGFIKATTFIINSDSYVEPFIAAYGGTMLGEGQEKSIIVKPSADQFNSILADDSVTVSMILERLD